LISLILNQSEVTQRDPGGETAAMQRGKKLAAQLTLPRGPNDAESRTWRGGLRQGVGVLVDFFDIFPGLIAFQTIEQKQALAFD
jgi:hypothetical protein